MVVNCDLRMVQLCFDNGLILANNGQLIILVNNGGMVLALIENG